MTSDSTIDIGLDHRKPWIQAGTQRPELDHNTGRHFDTPLCLVTSRPSFRQTRHLASHNSTPEGRAAEGGMLERRRRHARRTGCFGYTRVGAISPMQDLTVWPPSCVISENSRSLAAIFFSDGNTRHCSRVYISRDLIWIKIVVGKTIYKQIVIILAIRFAVLSTVFQWK